MKTNSNTVAVESREPAIEIEEIALETIAAALRVRTGLRAGEGKPKPITPCI